MFDIVVVGAGPAGATAARVVASAGARVLLLDRAALGRDKPCGGGLTPRAWRGLDVDIDDLVLARVEGAQLQRGRSPSLRVGLAGGAVWMVLRRDLDRRLVEAADAAGARVHMTEAVTAIQREAPGRIRVRTDRGSHRAGLVLLATGAEAPLRRSLGFAAPTPRMAAALELEGRGSCEAVGGSHFLFDYGVPDGYAWIFPKGDWWNAGILTTRPGMGRELRSRLEGFMSANGMRFDDPRLVPERATGRRIPFWLGFGDIQSQGVALIGDAAGLADPLFGEGIAQAISSGREAAIAALDVLAGRATGLEGYPRALRRSLGQHLRRTRQAARLLYAAPALSLRGLGAMPPVRRLATHVATERFR